MDSYWQRPVANLAPSPPASICRLDPFARSTKVAAPRHSTETRLTYRPCTMGRVSHFASLQNIPSSLAAWRIFMPCALVLPSRLRHPGMHQPSAGATGMTWTIGDIRISPLVDADCFEIALDRIFPGADRPGHSRRSRTGLMHTRMTEP